MQNKTEILNFNIQYRNTKQKHSATHPKKTTYINLACFQLINKDDNDFF